MKNHEVVIQAGRAQRHYWQDLWKNRELLYILAMRDISVRYKQTILGTSWSVIRPLTTMIIMVFVFSSVAKLKGDPGIPYPLTVLAGITIWTFFANAFTQISTSITANANLVTKVYFPRLIMPLSSIVVSFIDFLVSLGLFVLLAIYYQYLPDWHLIFLPFFIGMALMAAVSIGLFFAVLNVRFRDIVHLIPFMVQVGFYLCPIAYTSRNIANDWYYKYFILNPLVGIIDGFRWSLLGDRAFFDPNSILYSAIFIAVFLFISIYIFRKRENTFVDEI
ncbi:ABC transporter permease [Tellurirhabdus bombi]|uniref:ABC transporter permease n=1 Tax=Tellurirhabdus bombi TaxID=2907205 RepID=UPI001F23AC28|nr:ABC transporter permease [Tellurirhabdus bombi]